MCSFRPSLNSRKFTKDMFIPQLLSFRSMPTFLSMMAGDGAEAEYKLLPGGPSNGTKTKPEQPLKEEVRSL